MRRSDRIQLVWLLIGTAVGYGGALLVADDAMTRTIGVVVGGGVGWLAYAVLRGAVIPR